MPFQIVPRTDASLADLLELFRRGFHVLKTPHVGNAYPNNLAMAALGIPMLLVDQTVGTKDRNFHPHLVIADGTSELVADPARLTSHARVQRVSDRFPDRFAVGTSLADAHVQALRDAFPTASIETSTARSRRFIDLMIALLEVLTGLRPDSWQRAVGAEGVLSQPSPPRAWADVTRIGVHGISPDGCGWIVPNAWNILCDGVISARLTGRDTVYALSGPDMIRYYGGLMPEIEAGYEVIRQRVVPGLPETLTMVMVPVADMRFVTVRRRASGLDRLVEAYLRLCASNRGAGERLSALAGAEKEAAIKAIAAERGRLQREVRNALESCPEIFYRIEQADYLTQYDLLDGEELYVSDWAVTQPIGRIVEAMTLFRRLVPQP